MEKYQDTQKIAEIELKKNPKAKLLFTNIFTSPMIVFFDIECAKDLLMSN